MPKVEIDTKDLKIMVDNATERAITRHLSDISAMANDVADIKGALLGNGYDPDGIVKKVNAMWHDYLIGRWLVSFLGITTASGLVALVILINEVFFS